MENRFILTPFFLDEPALELESLARPGWNVNKPVLSKGSQQQRMSALYRPIAKFVANAVGQGERPVSIAGDCCTALGVLAGLQQANLNPVLLWLDAHGDFNTWETTPSGFVGGMPLAMLVGRGEQTMVQLLGLNPLPESQVILSDARDLDPAEEQALFQSKVHHVVDVISLPNDPLLPNPLYVHVDMDVIDPSDAPAMRYPAMGGPSTEDLQLVFQSLSQTDQIVAVSVATWAPALDSEGHSAEVCMELLQCLIG